MMSNSFLIATFWAKVRRAVSLPTYLARHFSNPLPPKGSAIIEMSTTSLVLLK